MENLTGVPDVDKLILLDLDDKSLSHVASTSLYINSLMDESFWASKFYNKYRVMLWKHNVFHRDVYREFSNLHDKKLIKRAIDYDFIELVESLLEGKNKEKLLVYAAKNGHLEVVKLLLDRGTNIHAKNDYALQWAAINGYLEVVKLLLDEGADIHAKDDYALRFAADYGYLKVVELLLDKGANIHANDDGALRFAARNGQIEVVKLLINRGADIHTYNDGVLRWVASKGNLEVVELLLDKGANIHAYEDGALRFAANEGHLEVVQLLLNNGAIPDNNTTKLINKLDPTILK